MPDSPSRRLAARWIGCAPVSVWGITATERLGRSLVRAGIWDNAVWTGSPPSSARQVLLFLGDHVFDDKLVGALARRPGTVLLATNGRPAAAHVDAPLAEAMARALADNSPLPQGLTVLRPEELVSPHRQKLRKREAPLVLDLNRDNRRWVEDQLFAASYKGVTDAITKYVWPAPARAVTHWCAERGIAPNAVTVASLVLALAAFVLFQAGWLGLGLLAAWGMTFLDTVDGKLARVTLTSSRLGDVLDHGLDLLHPPFWWWAWWAGSGMADPDPLYVMLIGYVLMRLQEGLFLKRFGMEMHVWRPFDSRFRLVTARRNPILLILTMGWLAMAPQSAFWVAALWTLISLTVHAARIMMAARAQGLRSWLEE